MQTSSQLGILARLGDVVVRARFKSCDDVFAVLLGCEQQDVDIGVFGIAASNLATEPHAIQFGHHPVDKSEARATGCGKDIDGLAPVTGDDHFVTKPLQCPLHHQAGHMIIFGEQYLHWAATGHSASRARVTLVNSTTRRSKVDCALDRSRRRPMRSRSAAMEAAPQADRLPSAPFRACAACCRSDPFLESIAVFTALTFCGYSRRKISTSSARKLRSSSMRSNSCSTSTEPLVTASGSFCGVAFVFWAM